MKKSMTLQRIVDTKDNNMFTTRIVQENILSMIANFFDENKEENNVNNSSQNYFYNGFEHRREEEHSNTRNNINLALDYDGCNIIRWGRKEEDLDHTIFGLVKK